MIFNEDCGRFGREGLKFAPQDFVAHASHVEHDPLFCLKNDFPSQLCDHILFITRAEMAAPRASEVSSKRSFWLPRSNPTIRATSFLSAAPFPVTADFIVLGESSTTE